MIKKVKGSKSFRGFFGESGEKSYPKPTPTPRPRQPISTPPPTRSLVKEETPQTRTEPKSNKEFQERYVLGIGYPWALGTGNEDDPHEQISLCLESVGVNFLEIDFPRELFSQEVPKYRLVLEREDVGERKIAIAEVDCPSCEHSNKVTGKSLMSCEKCNKEFVAL